MKQTEHIKEHVPTRKVIVEKLNKLKDEEKWKSYVDLNKDSYGACCVDVARRVMEMLNEDNTPLTHGYYPDRHTAHGMICIADDDIAAGGLTGFMSGMVARMVVECHTRGEEFRDSYYGKNDNDNIIK